MTDFLIERADCLEAENEDLGRWLAESNDAIDRLRNTLEWYADEENWESWPHFSEQDPCDGGLCIPAMNDGGARARAALGERQ